MKNLTITTFAAVTLLSIITFPLVSSAEITITTSETASTESQNTTDQDYNEREANKNADTNTETNSTTSIDSLVGIDQNIVTVDESESPSLQTSTSVIRKTEVKNENQEEILILSLESNSVSSESELETYITDLKERNREVENVKILTQEQQFASSETTDTNEVVIRYNHSAKLFGFIQVNMPSRTTLRVLSDTDASYDIETNLPWWGFLARDKTIAKDQLELEIKNDTMLQSYASAEASPQMQAYMIEKLVAHISTHTQVRASIQANTEESLN
jgi:hypothetical protein